MVLFEIKRITLLMMRGYEKLVRSKQIAVLFIKSLKIVNRGKSSFNFKEGSTSA